MDTEKKEAPAQMIPEEKIADLERDIVGYKETIAGMGTNNIELREVNAAMEQKIEEMERMLEASGNSKKTIAQVKPKAKIPSESFKVDGEEYVFTAPVFTNPLSGHSKITAEEALTNKDLLAYLVKNDTGLIKRKKS